VKLHISDLAGSDRVKSLDVQCRRCGCEDGTSAFRASTVQARDDTARLLDDRYQRDHVERLQGGFETQLDMPRRQHRNRRLALATLVRDHTIIVHDCNAR